jgi:hypothetical protein
MFDTYITSNMRGNVVLPGGDIQQKHSALLDPQTYVCGTSLLE